MDDKRLLRVWFWNRDLLGCGRKFVRVDGGGAFFWTRGHVGFFLK